MKILVLGGIGGIHAVDLGRLEHDFGTDLGTAQCSGGIGGEEGVAGAGGENDDPPLLEVTNRLAADVRLDDLLDVEGRLDAAVEARLAQCILQGHGVHDRRQHAHVVGGGAVHAGGGAGQAAEDVAAADDHADLDAEGHDRAELADDARNRLPVDAIGIIAHQGLARQFDEDALVGSGHADPA